MNDGPLKLRTGYFVEGLELFIHKVAYTKYDATVLVRWSNYRQIPTLATQLGHDKLPSAPFANSLFTSHAIIGRRVILEIESAVKQTKYE
jgi:hypothetical protein